MTMLDTHEWVWLVADPRQLSAPAKRLIIAASGVGTSSWSRRALPRLRWEWCTAGPG